jgi:uncharacterized 2Fe-2S/4Fe-4S cluster protein (DUF4445 family)
VIGIDLWSDDPGFRRSRRATGVTGICGSGIIEVVAEMYLAGIISEDGVIDGRPGRQSRRASSPMAAPSPTCSTTAIRDHGDAERRPRHPARQGGALCRHQAADGQARHRPCRPIRFAGAFGSFIDPKYAMVLGLMPDCDLAKVKAVGNAAGTGARMALVNRDYRREIEATVREIEKIETALEPKFQDHFVAAMALPNKLDPFPSVWSPVSLPFSSAFAAC